MGPNLFVLHTSELETGIKSFLDKFVNDAKLGRKAFMTLDYGII